MPLRDPAIRNAKPGITPKGRVTDKPYKLNDAGGLYLEVSPNGGKWWRFKYRFAGKEKRLSLGVYPEVTLKEARDRRDQSRKLLADGIDPSENRKAKKSAIERQMMNGFELIARQWFEKAHKGRAESTVYKNLTFLEKDVFPWIGGRAIDEITAPDLLAVIRRIESRGALDIARRTHNLCGRVFRYAVGHGLCPRDPSRDIELRDILPAANTRHHASITEPKEVGALLRAIDGYEGSYIVRCALQLAPLVFTRPGELRQAEWSEIDLEKGEWRIPASKMKMGEQHIVPLSSQAIAVFRDIFPLTGRGQFVLPGERSHARAISDNTLNAALRRMGFSKEQMTAHGFRSLASTNLHELGYAHAVIERQLAHGERNKVSAAYNFAEYLPERRRMMQQWGDYLDSLKTGGASNTA